MDSQRPAGLADAERSLVARIVAAPADDSLRLDLADWLAENGDPVRAEFIRARVAFDGKRPEFGEYFRVIERLRACDYVPPKIDLPDGFEFRPNLVGPVGWWSDGATGLDRGLPATAEFDGGRDDETEQLLADGLNVLIEATPIRGLFIAPELNHYASTLFAHPAAEAVTRLCLSFYARGSEPSREAVSLSRSPLARNLKHLTIDWDIPNDETANVLAAAHFDSIRRLDTGRWGCTFVGARRVREAAWFGRLEFLITEVPPGAFGPQRMPHLHTLILRKPADRNVRTFSGSAELPDLRRLGLSETDLMYGRAEALAGLRCGELVELWLSDCRFDLVDIRRLLAAPWARRLEVLTIAGGGNRPEIEETVRASPCGSTLKLLSLK